MVTGLRRVSWEKVDVSFHSSMTSFAAHSIIQVCSPLLSFQHPPLCWLSCDARLTVVEASIGVRQVKYAFMNEGADVIQHIIDHFQL
jgi:hypothetical protein